MFSIWEAFHVKIRLLFHYSDVIMGAMASQITSLPNVYSTFSSGADKKHTKLRVTGLLDRKIFCNMLTQCSLYA